ncbi:Bug family tripartite tricarboxylate transporter substrate binding protein [Alloalcanivorax sp. C16-2]|uniref:Bug family tripartite tricarboxylate transporter substrate binding protein n=1 Tax=Alloalcanivorax sp. C16-2 TaxID=3390052 RepID=UPI0039704760
MPITRLRAPSLVMLCGLILSSVGFADPVDAHAYPEREIEIVVPYPPGGATDTLARAVSQKLSERWGQAVVVDNRPGASGNIGASYVARDQGNPYRLLFGINLLVQAPALFDNLDYDVRRDLTPLSLVARSQSLFVATPDVPAETFDELVREVLEHPGEYELGNYGMGTSAHIQGESLNLQTGMDLLHVPYPGSAPLLNAILGQQVRLAIIDAASSRSHLDSDAFKVLAVTGSERLSTQPDVPTFKELGYEGLDAYGWFGVLAPAGIPGDVRDKLSAAISEVVRSDDVSSLLIRLGLTPVGNRGDEFAEVIEKDLKTWRTLVDETGISIR